MKRRASDEDVRAFMAAVYPLGPALATAAFDERLVLREATRLITELREAARAVLNAFDSGVFVRSVEHDSDPSWAVRLLPHLAALKRLQEAAQ